MMRAAGGALAVLVAAGALLTGCDAFGEKGGGKEAWVPVFHEASVHDPSIVRDENGMFYVFGSHLAAAKSPDLMRWELIASGVSDGNPLIPNVREELRETLEWAESDTLWRRTSSGCRTASTTCTTTRAGETRRAPPWESPSPIRSRDHTGISASF